MKPTLVILAAGMGSRYGGLKQVDAVGPSGETIMDYSIYDALKAGFGKVIFVIRNIEEDFRNCFTNKFHHHINYEFVYQELDDIPGGIEVPNERVKPWGTGHAVMVACNAISEPFAVINADDFYGYDAFVKMNNFLTVESQPHSYSMVGYKLEQNISDLVMCQRGL